MSRDPTTNWRRRGFLGGLLVAGGAAAGWMTRHFSQPTLRTGESTAPLDDRFVYDVSEFERTDPALLLYEPAGEFTTGLDQVKRLTVWPGHGIVVAGDRSLRWFSQDGAFLKTWPLPETPHCLHAMGDERLLAGYRDRFVVFDLQGRQQFASPTLGPKSYLTSMAVHEGRLYLADAGNREVAVCDLPTGKVLHRFGRKDPSLNNPGFNVPSPYFALAVAGDGQLRVANPGLLRVETYTLDGRFVSAWGEPGMRIDRFCGCCNPVYFALTPTGDYITSEKGLARIKVHAADGSFQGVVAGPDLLVADKELARRACVDCTVGAGFDVAAASNGEILALDPYRQTVRRFRARGTS